MSIEEDFVFPVYIYDEVLDRIKYFSNNSEKEIFGYLIGNILKWNDKNYIIIEDQLYIENAVHSNRFSTSQIKGKAGEYEKTFKELKRKRKNDNLRIVGWWHSHPDFGCFLSPTDLHTQEYFFPESYQVALVIDPIRDEFKFFTLDKTSEKKYKAVSNAIILSKR
ncbi:MAG: Mov34/MPN/PAD-1 family protein [Promethearchaeota archaeon]|nr:MAG: Mov34/MPN/PAD-1 family protein [Candidatus Lokiarchaeota archaeon]